MARSRNRQRGENLRSARPRRRRISLRREVGLHQARREKAGLPHLQRGRIGAGHFQGSLHHSPGSAPVDRGHVDQLLGRSNVHTAYIYIRGEFPEGAKILERAIEEARARNLLGKNILGTGFDVRDLHPSRRWRLHLRRGNRPDRIARRQARLSAHQAALFPRRARALHVPDDREQRRNALPREAHHRDGRRGIREDRPAEQYRHAHRLRERRRACGQVISRSKSAPSRWVR